jgi:transposase
VISRLLPRNSNFAIAQAAQQLWDGRLYTAATIEEWVYKYRRGKFGALQNHPRSDRGKPRTLEPEALEALLKLRTEYPTLTLQALTAELTRRGVAGLAGVSASTLRRRLLAAGLLRQVDADTVVLPRDVGQVLRGEEPGPAGLNPPDPIVATTTGTDADA